MSRGLKLTIGIVVAMIFCLALSQAFAQQQPEDGRAAVLEQLLTRANRELGIVGGQLQAAQIENAQLKVQIEKRRS